MTYQELHEALTQSVINLGTGLPIAFENSDFNPESAGDQFLDLTTLFGEQEVISKDSVDEILGVYQISVYTKSGTSVANALSVVDEILSFYRHNVTLTKGDTTVYILNSSRNAGRNENGWYVIDVSINFKSDVLR